ncbi:MAG TPA: hypothetical protein VFZ16_10225 [Hyphomicrobiaceae bacterium]|nr:hypothetical protein [Hyphomicrobiaceae bacterium]
MHFANALPYATIKAYEVNRTGMTPKISSWRGYQPGDRVVMLVETMGDMPKGREVIYPPGTPAVINSIDWLGSSQGYGVAVIIGEDDRTIVNVFDDGDVRDKGRGAQSFFRRADS